MAARPDLSIVSLRGGLNTTDAPSALPDDQVVQADNVEWFYSALGERRAGCGPLLAMTGSGLDTAAYIAHISQYFPGQTISNPTLLVVSASPSNFAIANQGVWTPLTPLDPVALLALASSTSVVTTITNPFDVTSQDLNAKDFIAYPSLVDRLHCWDGATLRRTGLAQPATAPSVGATGTPISTGLFWHVAAASSTGNTVSTAPITTANTNLLVAVVVDESTLTASTLTDNMGNSWVPLTSQHNVGGPRVTIWWVPGPAAPVLGVNHTFTVTGTSVTPSFCVQGWSSLGVPTVDQQNGTTSAQVSVTSEPSGGVTPQANSELVIVGLANSVATSGITIDTGFTVGDTTAFSTGHCYACAIASLPQSVSATVNPVWTWTTADNKVVTAVATFALSAALYTGTRYFRIRYIAQNAAGQVLRRSEPSLSVQFVAPGTSSGAQVNRPALLGEGETHWELEASQDNATFYRTQTLPIATTSAVDAVGYLLTYEPNGILSEAIGTYICEPSVMFLAVDGDRLLMGGHWTDPTRQSRVYWSPVFNDPGVGNDERIPVSSNNYFDLDNYTGGPLTGIASGGYGTWYAFKWGRIYVLTRTNNVTNAYSLLTLTTKTGAIKGSIVPGVDEVGNACVFFLDPVIGPCRVSVNNGIQPIQGLRNTWARVNRNANQIVARGCYYPYKQQLHWWVAADGNNLPTLKIVLQITQIQYLTTGGIGRGFSLADGLIAQATAVCVITEQVSVNGVANLSDRPVIGLPSPNYLQRCDGTETKDAGTPYLATVTTKPYFRTGLLNKWKAMAAAILATANPSGYFAIALIRDQGVEVGPQQTTPLQASPAGEPYVVETFDSLAMSGATSIQFQFGDPTPAN